MVNTEDWPYFDCQPLFFNQQRFRDSLSQSPHKLKVFKDTIDGVNTHFDRRFEEGEDVRFLVTERAKFVDAMLHYAWHLHSWGNDVALIAVGGYGRGELHPHSDIDILILLDDAATDQYQEEIRSFITLLWDMGLNIGSSVRTVRECIALAERDVTVATNLMEARRITGNDVLRDQVQILSGPEQMWSLEDFYRAKLAEQKERHRKYRFTEYGLEPNVKNAPGGLRDIQTVNWLAKRYFAVQTLTQLEGGSFFTEQEFGMLRQGESFLWRVRYGLHKLAGRAEERLLFEYQQELAKQFGYQDNERGLAIEQFMHRYYRTATSLRQINDILLRILEDHIQCQQHTPVITPIDEEFQLHNGLIEITHDKVFQNNPSALIRIFVIMCERPEIEGVHAQTIRHISEHRNLIDDDFRNNPENQALFLRMFQIETKLITQLKRMTRYGLLGRYLPEFGRITGQMQHDLFHRYTVDAHTLLVMQNVRSFRKESAQRAFPIAAAIMKRIEQPELLYIAALYHDIGKGRGGDHSELGATDAELFCQRHGLSGRETRLVAWLVRYHLLMSFVSQKKDISDPDVIHDFALKVGDIRHLDYLYALTVADMCGTNPDIWTSWRASLMHQLYTETKLALRRGLEHTIDQQDIIEETQLKAIGILQEKGLTEQQVRSLWGDMGEDYFLREGSQDIAWQTEALAHHNSDQPLILIRDSEHQPWRGATQIFVRVKDVENVFVAAATALSQLALNIQDARLYSSKSGYTIDTFYVLDENNESLGDDPKRLEAIRQALLNELKLVNQYPDVVRRRTPRQLKYFTTPARTKLYNDSNNNVSVLEVICPDRPGLLAHIGRVFMDMGIELQNAKISTLGERVEDVFFITDHDKKPLTDPGICQTLQETLCRTLDNHVKLNV